MFPQSQFKIVCLKKKEYDAGEMTNLYNERPNVWLLLEVVKYNEFGKAQRLKLLKTSKDKNELYDYLMDEDDEWDWNKNYIFVYSDPDKYCEL